MQVRKLEANIKYDWVNYIEWCPPISDPSEKPENPRTRTGFTPTPVLTDKDSAYVLFTDLTPDPQGEKTLEKYFMENYLEPMHVKQIEEKTVKNEQNRIIVKVRSQEISQHWLEVYSKKNFNDKSPKIQLIAPPSVS